MFVNIADVSPCWNVLGDRICFEVHHSSNNCDVIVSVRCGHQTTRKIMYNHVEMNHFFSGKHRLFRSLFAIILSRVR